MRVLHVDDDEAVRRSVAMYLTDEGWSVVSTNNGRLGLVALREMGEFDVVISDIRMPEMDGCAFIRAAKKEFPKPAYVVLSSQVSDAVDLLKEDTELIHLSKDEALSTLAEELNTLMKEKEKYSGVTSNNP